LPPEKTQWLRPLPDFERLLPQKVKVSSQYA
jgi:hypothetical protein